MSILYPFHRFSVPKATVYLKGVSADDASFRHYYYLLLSCMQLKCPPDH